GPDPACGLLGRRTAHPRRRTRSDGGGSDLGAGGQAQGPRRRGRGAGELGRPAMTVVLVDPRRPSLVPVEALALLSGEVAYTEELPVAVPWALPSAQSVLSGGNAPTLLSSDRDHPAVVARLTAGETLIAAPEAPAGERLIDAVAIMDRLRTDGPWESEQTHDSLRRFLLEETYELFDAVHSGDADELCAELGDVLLQV